LSGHDTIGALRVGALCKAINVEDIARGTHGCRGCCTTTTVNVQHISCTAVWSMEKNRRWFENGIILCTNTTGLSVR
jgi:hypothetical protein